MKKLIAILLLAPTLALAATKVRYRAIEGAPVNVADFPGYDSTDATVVTSAVQAAVTAAAGKTLVASGTFRVNTILLAGSTVYDFRAATFIKGPVAANGLFEVDGASNIQLYGGHFTGDGSSATYTDPLVGRTWVQGSTFYLHGGCSHVRIDGGVFDGTVNGWYANASGWFTGFSIYDCNHVEILGTRHMNANAGMNVQATAGDVFNVKIAQNTITGGGDDGITFMTDNKVLGGGGPVRSLFNCSAIDNLIDKTGMDPSQVAGVGIRVARAQSYDTGSIHHVSIAGNTFRNMATNALYVNHTTDMAISANVVNGYANKTGGGVAFWIGDAANAAVSRLTITGNAISGGTNAPAKAIEFDNVADSTVSGNVLAGKAAAIGILDLHWSTHNVVTANRIINSAAPATNYGVVSADSSDYQTILGNDLSASSGVAGGGANDVVFANRGATATSVTGSRAGNAALADILTKLAALGVIVDGTVP